VTVGEKKIRYYGTEINAGTFRGLIDIGNISAKSYYSPVTY